MRRRLVVMRHAKSAWDTEAPSDHARPLNDRGRGDAPRIGRALADLGWAPDLVWSSDSARTRQTWALLAAELDVEVRPVFDRRLYLAGLGALQEVARQWPDDATTALVLGHNPGWEDAVSTLAGRPVGMSTAEAALLLGEGATWGEALEAPWRLERMLRPKEL